MHLIHLHVFALARFADPSLIADLISRLRADLLTLLALKLIAAADTLIALAGEL